MTPSERRALAASLDRRGLEPLDVRIVSLRLGLEDGRPHARQAVAAMVGLSIQEVDEREMTICANLLSYQTGSNTDLAVAILERLRQPENLREIQSGRSVDQIGSPRRS